MLKPLSCSSVGDCWASEAVHIISLCAVKRTPAWTKSRHQALELCWAWLERGLWCNKGDPKCRVGGKGTVHNDSRWCIVFLPASGGQTNNADGSNCADTQRSVLTGGSVVRVLDWSSDGCRAEARWVRKVIWCKSQRPLKSDCCLTHWASMLTSQLKTETQMIPHMKKCFLSEIDIIGSWIPVC